MTAPVTSGSEDWIRRCLDTPADLNIPDYRSPAWHASTDRRAIVAATVRAAELWSRCGDYLAPPETHGLTRRQLRIVEANVPRPKDHRGGPVPTWGPAT